MSFFQILAVILSASSVVPWQKYGPKPRVRSVTDRYSSCCNGETQVYIHTTLARYKRFAQGGKSSQGNVGYFNQWIKTSALHRFHILWIVCKNESQYQFALQPAGTNFTWVPRIVKPSKRLRSQLRSRTRTAPQPR